MTGMSVQHRHPKPFHPLSHQHRKVEVRREKKEPQRQESVWKNQSTAVPCDSWHAPECQFNKSKSGCKFSKDHAQKPTLNAATPSEPSMTRGRSVSRKRSIKGTSNPCMILRQPCRYNLKGTCTRSLCECWHPQNESGCKAEDKCLFPHHKVDEQPNKKPKATIPKKEEKATTNMQWLL